MPRVNVRENKHAKFVDTLIKIKKRVGGVSVFSICILKVANYKKYIILDRLLADRHKATDNHSPADIENNTMMVIVVLFFF